VLGTVHIGAIFAVLGSRFFGLRTWYGFGWLGVFVFVFFLFYADRCFELFELHGSLGLFVLGALAAFGGWSFLG
jgi:hypothetical protein